MSKEIRESLTKIALQLQEQLRFYRDIGLPDIGGSGVTKPAPASGFGSSPGSYEPPPTSTAGKLPPQVTTTATAAPRPPEAFAANSLELPEAKPQPSLPIVDAAVTAPASENPMLNPSAGGAQAGLLGNFTAGPGIAAERNALPLLSALPVDASLEVIRADLGDCTRCKLHEGRGKIVFGEGNPQARLMFIGEGPGADEDATGRPFVGRAGQLLDKIIAAIGFKRQDVYISNVVKCRPPQNRTPERDEVETCEPFLFRQIALIKPKVIVALGSPAFQCLLRTREPISKARGELRDWNGIKVMPTFHPAYLLRSPDKKREAWEDMKIVRDYLNSLPD